MIYLDNSATTMPAPEVIEAVVRALREDFGNPSSPHGLGLAAERIVRRSRERVAALLGVKAGEVYFTSGGTEANNLAIKGGARALVREGRHLVTTAVEHPSVLNVFRALENEGFEVTRLAPDGRGEVSAEALSEALRPDTILVSVMHVNNETGSVMPVAKMAAMLKKLNPKALFHVDAVQSCGKIPLTDVIAAADLVSISAHKLHGPKGVGALWVRRGTRLVPLLDGGEQEGGLRSGTENVPGIAGFGEAARLAAETVADFERIRRLKEMIAEKVTASLPWAVVNGPAPSEGAPHILNLSFPGVGGEILVHHLEARGVYVSTGAACSARKKAASHVLEAMGVGPARRDSAIRISLSRHTSEEEAGTAATIISETAAELKSLLGRGGSS